jgi:hypothetical protein
MFEIESIEAIAPTEEERSALGVVADLLDRIEHSELSWNGGVLFDSCDQFYIDCDDLAKRFRLWLGVVA